MSLLGVKRTWRSALQMSAFDPKRTLAKPLPDYWCVLVRCRVLSLGAIMRRRDFITLLGGAAVAWPLATRAQQGERVRRIGVLVYWAADTAEGQARVAALVDALKQFGWSDGRNLRIDIRWATANDIGRHAAELVANAPDVLVAGTGTATVAPLISEKLQSLLFLQSRIATGVATGSIADRRPPDRSIDE